MPRFCETGKESISRRYICLARMPSSGGRSHQRCIGPYACFFFCSPVPHPSRRPSGEQLAEAVAGPAGGRLGSGDEEQPRPSHPAWIGMLAARRLYRRSKSGFFTFSQFRHRPLAYRPPRRFETMPSSPSRHAWSNTSAPSPSIASLKVIPSTSATNGQGADRGWLRGIRVAGRRR